MTETTEQVTNEPKFPYFGGTDNPGDNTAIAGGGVKTETGGLSSKFLQPNFPVFGGQDTTIGIVPVSGGDAGADYGDERSADPTGGFTNVRGEIREAGQDETIGTEETSPDDAPGAFPEPNP